MVIWIKFDHSSPFVSLIAKVLLVHSCHLLFDHLQFTLIHGHNIPGSYAILFFIASDSTSNISHIHNWTWFSIWFCLFILSGVISSLFSSGILGTYWPGEFLGNSLFSFLSFCLFILLMGFSRWEYWSGLPFPSPVDHILSELSTMTCPSWVALHRMAQSFIELDKAVIHVISLISFLWCLPQRITNIESRRDFRKPKSQVFFSAFFKYMVKNKE